MKVLVWCEVRGGKLRSSSLEAVGAGLRLAGAGGTCSAIVIGRGVSEASSELQRYGVATVYEADHADLEPFHYSSICEVLESAVKASGPQIILAMASPLGRDVLPRFSARTGAGIVTDVVDLSLQDGRLVVKKPLYAGKCVGEFEVLCDPMALVTLRPNVFPRANVVGGAAQRQTLAWQRTATVAARVLEVRQGKGDRADLTEATRIISGGRALASADNFRILFECADAMGASVGASRAAVDAGYATHDMQVGQTGKTVNPNLYIACGLSGSIQHMAGMRTSKVIVAINTDPEAPIFGIATYGIVADLFQAVPVLTGKLRESQGS